MTSRIDGAVVRDRGAVLRAVGNSLSARFSERQTGGVRPALTLDDGTLVVTDNYLKLRIPEGHRRNERVRVKVTSRYGAVVVQDSSTNRLMR